jgi:hypothetical protein
MRDLKGWAHVAEITASLAVVVSVFFIVFELRSNTNAIQAQTYQAITTELNDWREFGLLDPRGAARFTQADLASASLEEVQIWRTRRLILWANYESAYFARQRGILGDEEWVRFEMAICRAYGTDSFTWNFTKDNWNPTPFVDLLTPNFVDFILDKCSNER